MCSPNSTTCQCCKGKAPYWEPELHVPERIKTFVPRVLADFCEQWGHIVRNRYNDQTFLRLGRAVVRLATMDFGVYEVTEVRCYVTVRRFYICASTLPDWKPFDTKMIQLGKRECVVISRDPAGAMSLIRSNADRQREKGNDGIRDTVYMILSLRYIILCRMKTESILELARPEKLFDKDEAPSERAFDLLLFFLHAGSAFKASELSDTNPRSTHRATRHDDINTFRRAL